MKTHLYFFLFSCFLFAACKHPVPDLQPTPPPVIPPVCDTTNISFQLSVLPIMAQHCYVCHKGAFASGDIKLDNYKGVLAVTGRLIGSLRHEPGYLPMPEAAPKLSECHIDMIEAWIRSGSQHN